MIHEIFVHYLYLFKFNQIKYIHIHRVTLISERGKEIQLIPSYYGTDQSLASSTFDSICKLVFFI